VEFAAKRAERTTTNWKAADKQGVFGCRKGGRHVIRRESVL